MPVERDLVARRRRSLPHWEHPGGTYFVTFRLDDSLPSEISETYYREQRELKAHWQMAGDAVRVELEREMARLYCRRIDRCLDVGLGHCYLAQPSVAKIVSDAIQHFDRDRYDLFAWCLLPNHVHVVFRPLGENGLAGILHSWKGFTSRSANARLRRRGAFWQREYFDHLVRSQNDLERFVRYVWKNPEKAGHPNSPWRWVCDELKPSL